MKKGRMFLIILSLKNVMYIVYKIRILQTIFMTVLRMNGDMINVFFNSLASNSRGTAIFFNNTIDFVLHTEEKDNNGNFIILDVT